MGDIAAISNLRQAQIASEVSVRVAKLANNSAKQVAAALIGLVEQTTAPERGTCPDGDCGGRVDTYA